MTTRRATCSCGQLAVTVEGEPIRVSMCHCLACQKRTGAPFGAQARYARANAQIEGTSKTWVRVGDAGTRIEFQFCPECGSTVHYTMPPSDWIAIPVGAFADPTFPPPVFSVYEARRHAWVAVPENAEHWD
jgi:hypothetical protein